MVPGKKYNFTFGYILTKFREIIFGIMIQKNNDTVCLDIMFQNIAIAIAKSLQSCPTLCDPIDGSPPGFPVHGIFQARVLEWVAIAFSVPEYEKM